MATGDASAVEAAKAVNALLGLSSSDQAALLEVLEDYFTSPDPDTEQDELEDDTEDEEEGTLPYTKLNISFSIITQHLLAQTFCLLATMVVKMDLSMMTMTRVD